MLRLYNCSDYQSVMFYPEGEYHHRQHCTVAKINYQNNQKSQFKQKTGTFLPCYDSRMTKADSFYADGFALLQAV